MRRIVLLVHKPAFYVLICMQLDSSNIKKQREMLKEKRKEALENIFCRFEIENSLCMVENIYFEG